MSERCKKCGRDTTKDVRYYRFTDRITNEKGELIEGQSYIVCENCYPKVCPKCGFSMETEDCGMGEFELLFCRKCGKEFYVEFHGNWRGIQHP